MDGFYPSDQVATSGFALALFLVEHCPATRIVLAGFTARRSKRWKLFSDHDWTFEQIVQRLLLRAGESRRPAWRATIYSAAIATRFPEVSPRDVALVSAEVLPSASTAQNAAIDDLLRTTRTQRRFGDWLRSLKPKTRKARIAERDRARDGDKACKTKRVRIIEDRFGTQGYSSVGRAAVSKTAGRRFEPYCPCHGSHAQIVHPLPLVNHGAPVM